MEKLNILTTEKRNKKSMHLDSMSTNEILKLVNKEDQTVAEKVNGVIPQIELAVEKIITSFKNGGRLFYIGAGTSGRIAIQDAVECPPTFSVSPFLVQGLIAGGNNAFIKAVEGAEDREALGETDLIKKELTENDVVIGVAASGRTPYVIGGLKYAQKINATTISLASNENSIISRNVDVRIEVITGPEVLTGSTRMKAATAHKMVLNMITTTVMIKIGKVFENLMVDLNVSNYKLKERAKYILQVTTSITRAEAEDLLNQTNYAVKPAIVMAKTSTDFEQAQSLLDNANGIVKEAIKLAIKK